MSNEDKTTDPLLEILARVRSMDSRLASVETRLDSLETKVEERSRETRPMWEQALKEIMDSRLESNQRFAEVDRRFVEMDQQFVEAGKGIKSLSRKIDILHDDVFNVRESHAELQERIGAIENNAPTERLK